MTHIDLFSGIGGFALAADRVWGNVEHVFCEIDPFCQAILRKHWSTSIIYDDIRTFTNTRRTRTGGEEPRGDDPWASKELAGCDLLTGGFPCQPFSAAGKRKGTNDERHLWPEMRRVIQEFSPRYVVAENVRGLLSIEGGLVFEQVCLDLEAIGYEVQPFVIPACAVNAPHRRDRLWIVAYRDNSRGRAPAGGANQCREATSEKWEFPQCRTSGHDSTSINTASEQAHSSKPRGLHTEPTSADWRENWVEVAARLCRVDDGLSEGVARPRGWRNAALKAYGNAIVPQVAEMIFRSLKLS